MVEKDLMVSVYLAYRAGVFDGLPGAPERGLDKERFLSAAIQIIQRWDDAVIVEVGRPVGMMAMNLLGPHAVTRAFWFPWATTRNKVEATLKFILDYRQHIHLMAAGKDDRLLEHMFPYGVVRGIGFSKGWDATLYEAVEATY